MYQILMVLCAVALTVVTTLCAALPERTENKQVVAGDTEGVNLTSIKAEFPEPIVVLSFDPRRREKSLEAIRVGGVFWTILKEI